MYEQFESRTTNMKIEINWFNDEPLCQGAVAHRAQYRALSRIRSHVTLMSGQSRDQASRAHLRELRAAEMTIWETTGGDYLVSRHMSGEVSPEAPVDALSFTSHRGSQNEF
jgi:hypothetical protein